MMRPETVGIFACLGGYAVTGNAPVTPRVPMPPTSLRSRVPLGSTAASWRAKQLLEEAQMKWHESQETSSQSPDEELQSWEIAQILNEMHVSPPVAVFSVEMEFTGVRHGQPHRAKTDEVDLEIFESVQGAL